MLTFAIGDIHGEFGKFCHLLDNCTQSANDRPHRFITLGDYVDRGPDSAQVVDFLSKRQGRELQLPEDQKTLLCLKGNHEDMLVGAFDGERDMWECWYGNGGL